ncbi:helix-turn-helix domain-containing protein [Brevundimonas diminuta]|uniref:helix-turn-helix domain-containing protein n=1 Tax=Brevundimonas diminuta TaxID=293 RepID=UPI0020976D50|nr:helix-turn-helix transcriptional regulator [Brevundimonas diminuta]MCO8017913.1 helix-turn-helix domain-containing protein [Brevundimonas diminuta]MCO8021433.1 helix-turn-helix domain-containing protein [Brevundimonas diminuta]
MAHVSKGRAEVGRLLRATLQAVRRFRGLRVPDAASAMNMASRTYENFESGRSRADLDLLQRFGRATDCDPAGVVFSVWIGSPDYARRTADNKMSSLFLLALETFNREQGDRIAHLDPRTIMLAFNEAFESLARDASSRQAALNALNASPASPHGYDARTTSSAARRGAAAMRSS